MIQNQKILSHFKSTSIMQLYSPGPPRLQIPATVSVHGPSLCFRPTSPSSSSSSIKEHFWLWSHISNTFNPPMAILCRHQITNVVGSLMSRYLKLQSINCHSGFLTCSGGWV